MADIPDPPIKNLPAVPAPEIPGNAPEFAKPSPINFTRLGNPIFYDHLVVPESDLLAAVHALHQDYATTFAEEAKRNPQLPSLEIKPFEVSKLTIGGEAYYAIYDQYHGLDYAGRSVRVLRLGAGIPTVTLRGGQDISNYYADGSPSKEAVKDALHAEAEAAKALRLEQADAPRSNPFSNPDGTPNDSPRLRRLSQINLRADGYSVVSDVIIKPAEPPPAPPSQAAEPAADKIPVVDKPAAPIPEPVATVVAQPEIRVAAAAEKTAAAVTGESLAAKLVEAGAVGLKIGKAVSRASPWVATAMAAIEAGKTGYDVLNDIKKGNYTQAAKDAASGMDEFASLGMRDVARKIVDGGEAAVKSAYKEMNEIGAQAAARLKTNYSGKDLRDALAKGEPIYKGKDKGDITAVEKIGKEFDQKRQAILDGGGVLPPGMANRDAYVQARIDKLADQGAAADGAATSVPRLQQKGNGANVTPQAAPPAPPSAASDAAVSMLEPQAAKSKKSSVPSSSPG